MKNYNQIQSDLEQFIGTINYYKMFDFLFTDGVKYFIDLCPCAMQILLTSMKETVKNKLEDEMQFIKIKVSEENKEYNKIEMYSEPDLDEPHFWDVNTTCPKELSLPEGEYRIWYNDKVFLLPSEY